MARTFARIYTTVWNDPEFRALGPAQHTYFLILAQPKLSLVGCIDVKPRSWSAMSGLTTGQIASQIDTLEQASFVVVDGDTEELLIRTYVQNDQATANGNLIKGMWSAWATIESQMLRQVVVQHMPDKCFDPKFGPLSKPPLEPWSKPGFQPGSEPGSEPIDMDMESVLVPGRNRTGAPRPVDNPPEPDLSPVQLAALAELDSRATTEPAHA